MILAAATAMPLFLSACVAFPQWPVFTMPEIRRRQPQPDDSGRHAPLNTAIEIIPA